MNFTPNKVNFNNIVALSDSYKYTHAPQYPDGTQNIYSYFESRGGKFDNTVFFGLQYLLTQYLAGQVVTREGIERVAKRSQLHFGRDLFNRQGWEYIADKHNGYLPLVIKAVPEGTVVPTHNVLMTVENTDPNCYWLTNFIETLLVQAWYPTTVATMSREMKKVIHRFLEETGDPSTVEFKLQDFGFRGVSSVESAALGGAAHLVNFLGSDTFVALDLLDDVYGEECAGFSIPASEHSTMTSWGKLHEKDAYENMLKQFPDGIIACVSDSYDIFNACRNLWGGKLRDKVLERDGVLVVRPDSGNARVVVPEVIKILMEQFGYSTNAKGYDVLNPHVRVIQGDGVELHSAVEILAEMKAHGQSADNIAFGMGGALLQKLDRDTQKFAFKCAEAVVNGEAREVSKDPITDPGKKSKAGRLALVKKDDKFQTVNEQFAKSNNLKNELVTVFKNGYIQKSYTLAEIRENAKL